MSGLELVGTVIVGGLAGWIASLIVRWRRGLFFNLVTGVIGSFAGSAVAARLGFRGNSGFAGILLISTLGAILLLGLVGLFRRET